MKVNLPISMAQTRMDVSAKSTGQAKTEAISPFSIQMNQILRRDDDRDGVLGGNAHPDPRDEEFDDEASGSISNSGLSGKQTDISGCEGSDSKASKESKPVIRAGHAMSKNVQTENGSEKDAADLTENAEMSGADFRKAGGAAASIQRSVSGEEASSGGESSASLKSLAKTDYASLHTARNENIPHQSKPVDDGKPLGRVSENNDSNSVAENNGEMLRVHAAHEKTGSGRSELEKLNRMESSFVEDFSKHGDTVRKTDVSRIHAASDSEASTQTPERDSASGGENGESRDNSNQMASVKALSGNGNPSQAAQGNSIESAKGHRVSETTGTAHQAAAGSTHVSESHSSSGMNPMKTITPNSNDFLSRITERIHFLLRDGGEMVRIKLQPDEFGHMEVRAESTARGIAVRIAAENGSVKSMLENNLHVLQQNLQELGLKVDRIQIELHEFFEAQSNAGIPTKSGHSNSGQNEKGTRRNSDQKENSPEGLNSMDADVGVFNQDARFYTVA